MAGVFSEIISLEVKLITRRLVLFIVVLVLAGCSQNIRYQDLNENTRPSHISYEAYYYVGGSGDRSRAVLLKNPDAGVEVETASPQITSTTSTFADAMSYMKAARGLRRVNVRALTYKDRPLGYLLTYDTDRDPTEIPDNIIVELYEFGGKIHFNAKEKLEQDN